MRRFFTFFFLLYVLTTTGSASSSPAPGSYTTTKPSTITDPPPPSITSNIKGPVLTTDWCASLAFSDTSENMFAHPLAFRCTSTGLELGYPNQTVVEANYYGTPFSRDIGVSIDEIKPGGAMMDAYSDWAVRASWDNGKMKATMAHGSPFVYFDVDGTVVISFAAKANRWLLAGEAVGITVNGRHYGIFVPGGTATIGTSKMTFSLSGEVGHFSIALLPDTLTETLLYFERFAFNPIKDTRVTWEYNSATALVTTRYSATLTKGTQLLFALYPHQWQHFSGELTGYAYHSVRGTMKVVEGSSFSTTQPFTGILPHLPMMAKDGINGFKRATLEGYITSEAAQTDNAIIRTNEDTYWTGKDFGRTAQLVRIAEQLGNTSARDRFLDVMKSRLEDWCVFDKGETAGCFYYNKTWGTLIGAKPSYDSDKSLNDHHFHYGYFVYAAATVAQFDRAWALKWKPMIDLIIRDCNSPFRSDSLFPFMRSFDLYAGHSWASGNALFSSGNNQESTSEAINFAAGTALWGMATGDTLLRDLGIFLYTTEKNALLNYWFDIYETIFPPAYNHAMAGIVWGEKAAYETWFSTEPECIHGINMLPVTAASLYLGASSAYIRKNFAEIEKNNGGAINEWHDILWEYLALGDGAGAVQKLSSGASYTPESGETKAHTYHWIHNIAAAGAIDTTIVADAPSYAVFTNNTARTYVVWNPEATGRVVSFSNNKACTVPPGKLASFTDADMTATAIPAKKAAAAIDNTIRVTTMPGGWRIVIPAGNRTPGTIRIFDSAGRLLGSVAPINDGTPEGWLVHAKFIRRATAVYIVEVNGKPCTVTR